MYGHLLLDIKNPTRSNNMLFIIYAISVFVCTSIAIGLSDNGHYDTEMEVRLFGIVIFIPVVNVIVFAMLSYNVFKNRKK